MKIGIIDCGGANLNSIYYSFKRMNIKTHISNSLYELKKMDAFILPGVGTAGVVMNKLKENNLINLIQETTKPTLGICIGMQILFEFSDEGKVDCLGLIPGSVERFKSLDHLKVPQMGWNKVSFNNSLSEFNNYYYFANSYYSQIYENTLASAEYGHRFAAAVQKDNFIGCQFHPEKSSSAGIEFLDYFLSIN